MDRNTNCSRLIRYSTSDCLPNPPCRISTELITFIVIKFLDCLDKTEIAFLNQVEEQHATSHVPFCNTDHKTKIRFRETFLCFLVSLFHAFGKHNFLFRRKKGHTADFLQIHTNGIINADAFRNRKIDFFFGLLDYAFAPISFSVSRFIDNVDSLLTQNLIKLFHRFR